MNHSKLDIFYEDIALKSADKKHYDKLHFNIEQYRKKVPQGKAQFNDLEEVRIYLHSAKHNAIGYLDTLLETFEAKFTARGGKVIWADTAEEAVAHIVHICKSNQADFVVKSKSMVSEEIELNYALKKFGIHALETDLGEFIQQLQGKPPYHILTPAMHLSKEDVAHIYEKELGLAPHLSPQEITDTTRFILREKFLKAKVGITGANFLVANSGSVVITENEGNARMATTFPDVHIAVVGIEKIIEHIHDLPIFLPMLATHGTGQKLTSYNTIFNAPMQHPDGSRKSMYVILLNNGRTNLLSDADVYNALFCIRCGACLNACPVYKTIGGHAYNTTYSGPIGAVISPHLRSMQEYGHLSFASSLCGACTEVCPVKIPLHSHLLSNRTKMIASQKDPSSSQWKMWRFMMKRRWLLDLIPNSIKNNVLKEYARKFAHKTDVWLHPLSKKNTYQLIKKSNLLKK